MGGMISRGNVGELSEADFINMLGEGQFKNIVVMCGAGISTNAGIPDFRSPSAGLYFKLRKYNLPYPTAVFEGRYFDHNPLPFYGLVREIFPEDLQPTITHKFFSFLHQKGYLRRIYTQNIDALEFLGGVPADKIIEAHGSFRESYCKECRREYSLAWLKTEIFNPEKNEGVPKCENESCKGVVRPNVVLFGEALPARFWENISSDFSKCDLLLVLGTSLVVSPFNTLVAKPSAHVPRVYINKTKPGGSGGLIGWVMSLGVNIDFSRKSDLALYGDCDQIVEKIGTELDWWEQIKNLPVRSFESLIQDAEDRPRDPAL